MRALAIALSALLFGACLPSSAGAQATTTQDYSADLVRPATKIPSSVVQLAGSFNKSTNKLGDKYLAGKSGGRYGIGGTESIIFKKKKKK